MSDQFIQVPPQSTGLKIDVTELTVGANTVERERMNIADPATAAALAAVLNSAPSGSNYGLVTWNQPSGTQAVSGTVTANAGTGTFTTSDSHLPSAVALADNLSNPTTTEVGANLLAWDATNSVFRRVQVDAGTGTLKVDGSGATQPVSGTVTANQGAPPWTVQAVGDGTLLSGQQAVTASAVALATNSCKSVTVKALFGNTINVYVGPSGITTATGYELGPGDSVSLPVSNTNLVFVIASTTGASVSWIAVN